MISKSCSAPGPIGFTASCSIQLDEMFMPAWKLFLLYCHGRQRFHSTEHGDFPAHASSECPSHHFLRPTMLPYKQSDHDINFFFPYLHTSFGKPAFRLLFRKSVQLGREQMGLSLDTQEHWKLRSSDGWNMPSLKQGLTKKKLLFSFWKTYTVKECKNTDSIPTNTQGNSRESYSVLHGDSTFKGLLLSV